MVARTPCLTEALEELEIRTCECNFLSFLSKRDLRDTVNCSSLDVTLLLGLLKGLF